MKIRMATLIGAAMVLGIGASAESADYEFFKTKVQPIFLKHRDTHGRCVTCHSGGSTALVLQPLADGSTTWTEEQTKLNYEAVSRIVAPGKPTASQLLMHPLAPEAGGDMFRIGGPDSPQRVVNNLCVEGSGRELDGLRLIRMSGIVRASGGQLAGEPQAARGIDGEVAARGQLQAAH